MGLYGNMKLFENHIEITEEEFDYNIWLYKKLPSKDLLDYLNFHAKKENNQNNLKVSKLRKQKI